LTRNSVDTQIEQIFCMLPCQFLQFGNFPDRLDVAMSVPDVHAVDSHGWTALHHAVEQGNKRLLVQCSEAGADIGACNNLGDTPLHLAARAGRVDLVDAMPSLITSANLERRNKQGFTPVQEALLLRQWAMAALLIGAGAAPYSPDSTASLRTLAKRGTAPLDPVLLLKGTLADPTPTGPVAQALRWRGAGGRTILHFHASYGSYQQVANLVKAGANREALDDNQRTPLCLAAMGGHAELVPLLATPATINMYVTGTKNGTPLSAAAAGGHMEMVEALLAAGAEPAEPSWYTDNPLAVAVRGGHMQLVPVLLQALASKYVPQQQGQASQQQQRDGQGTSSWADAAHVPEVLVHVVAGALSCVARDLCNVPSCCQLLELLLDQLGPELTGRIYCRVQDEPQDGVPSSEGYPLWWEYSEGIRRPNYLAEALLLGWMGAEGRRRIPARLQRLVSGGGGVQQQQQQDREQQQQLVLEAIVPAIYGQQQKAGALLGDCAELYLQHSSQDGSGVPGVAAQPPVTVATSQGLPPQQTAPNQGRVPALAQLVHGGLVAVANMHKLQHEAGVLGVTARDFTAGKVLNTFMSAWVAARSVSSQELVGAVVAAVKAAHRQ
jgi:ankyrin repeat protein